MATTNNLVIAQKSFIPNPKERETVKLKFWDTRDKVMLDWNTVRQTAFNRDGANIFYSVFGDPHRYLQLECSGVPDSKGNIAYEGDVVKHSPHWQSKLEYSLVSRKK